MHDPGQRSLEPVEREPLDVPGVGRGLCEDGDGTSTEAGKNRSGLQLGPRRKNRGTLVRSRQRQRDAVELTDHALDGEDLSLGVLAGTDVLADRRELLAAPASS